jgi:hypothetical protein
MCTHGDHKVFTLKNPKTQDIKNCNRHIEKARVFFPRSKTARDGGGDNYIG